MKCVWTVALSGVILAQWVWGDCVKTGPCSCEDPEQGVIDLSALDGHGSPRFKDQQTITGEAFFYSWNPCSPFSELSSCQSVSACQVTSDHTLSYPLGTQDSATFSTDSTTKDLTLQYSATDPSTGDIRNLGVLLVCDPTDNPGTLTVLGSISSLNYAMSLSSYYCCYGASHDGGKTGGLSVGSVLVIVFFSVLLVYLVAGVMFMKFVRKAEGKEVVPNYSIWTAIPGLIKDGVLFTFRGACSLCGRKGAYSEI